MSGIKNPKELEKAIKDTLKEKDRIYDIYKYKWYNYYQNIHIKKDSEADVENEKIFEKLKIEHPEIHKQVEELIDYEIERLNSGAADFD